MSALPGGVAAILAAEEAAKDQKQRWVTRDVKVPENHAAELSFLRLLKLADREAYFEFPGQTRTLSWGKTDAVEAEELLRTRIEGKPLKLHLMHAHNRWSDNLIATKTYGYELVEITQNKVKPEVLERLFLGALQGFNDHAGDKNRTVQDMEIIKEAYQSLVVNGGYKNHEVRAIHNDLVDNMLGLKRSLDGAGSHWKAAATILGEAAASLGGRRMD